MLSLWKVKAPLLKLLVNGDLLIGGDLIGKDLLAVRQRIMHVMGQGVSLFHFS